MTATSWTRSPLGAEGDGPAVQSFSTNPFYGTSVALPARVAGGADLLGPNQTGTLGDNTAAGNPYGALDAGSGSGVSQIDTSAVASDRSLLQAIGEYQNQVSGSDEGFEGSTYGNGGGVSYDYGATNYGGGGSSGGYSYGGSYGGGYYGYGYGVGYGYEGGEDFGSGSSAGPIVLDLTGSGIKITPKGSSDFFYDMAGDGYQHLTASPGAGNGLLVLDTRGDGKITERSQVVFTDWDPTATSDMQALRDVFDTNHNGRLDAGDAQFSNFKIEVINADGTMTLETLAQAGVKSIDLSADQTKQVFTDGSSIDGETTFTKTDGTTGTAATVTLASDSNGYAVTTTTLCT